MLEFFSLLLAIESLLKIVKSSLTRQTLITSRSDSSGRIEIKVKALTNDYDKLELWRVKIPTKDNDDYEKLENPRADLVKNKFSEFQRNVNFILIIHINPSFTQNL